jgi:hypothetical protein
MKKGQLVADLFLFSGIILQSLSKSEGHKGHTESWFVMQPV